MTELNPPYVMKKILVDKDSIKNFSVNEEDRRKLREGKIKELSASLNKKVHFNSPLVVNEINGKWRLIDGNHRYEALKITLSQNKNFEMNSWIAFYRGLSKDKEREIYRLWNMGVSQTATDYIKAYFKTIPYGEEMLRRLPVTIYGNNKSLNIKLLVGCQIDSKRLRKFTGGYGAGREKTVSDFAEITSKDIDVMSEFCDFMEEVFGSFDRESNSLFYKSTPFATFYRIWYDNRNQPNLAKLFKKIFVSNAKQWESSANGGGRSACLIFYSNVVNTLKRLDRTNSILSDAEAIVIREKEREIIESVKQNKK